jgi:hypothetical protein
MKSFFTQLVLIAGLSVLAVSCGGSKGGSKSSAAAVNPLAYNLNTTSAQALANVTAWYNSTSEGAFGTPGMGGFFATREERIVKVYAANGGCSTKPIKFLGLNLGNFQSCNSSNTIQSSNNVITAYSPTPNGGSKASAARVTSILNGSLGSITNVSTSQGQSGAIVYVLTVTPDVNQPSLTKVYAIDTGVNSALNPVYSMDSATRTEESLYQILI